MAAKRFLLRFGEAIAQTKFGKRFLELEVGRQVREEMNGLNTRKMWLFSGSAELGGVCGITVVGVTTWSISRFELAHEFDDVNTKLDKLIMDSTSIIGHFSIEGPEPTLSEVPTSSSLFKRMFPLPWE